MHERHRLGRIGGVVYGSSITTLEEAGIAQILIRDVVKGFRAVRRSHTVDLRDNETELGQWLYGDAKSFWNEVSLRPSVDRFNDRIFPGRIEIQW